MNLLWDFIITLLIIWPPYVANATPVVAGKVFRRRTPIDLGRNFIDGKRLFGDGKTYEGFVTGLLAGFVIGELTYIIITRAVNMTSELPNPLAVFVMCIAALLGDLLGAFIKRRLGLPPRGAPAPLLDQLDFLLAALLAYAHSAKCPKGDLCDYCGDNNATDTPGHEHHSLLTRA